VKKLFSYRINSFLGFLELIKVAASMDRDARGPTNVGHSLPMVKKERSANANFLLTYLQIHCASSLSAKCHLRTLPANSDELIRQAASASSVRKIIRELRPRANPSQCF
jgi:hypothetical protein